MATSCSHYVRKCALFTPCCLKFYSCRLCHNEQENHELIRKFVQQVKCNQCGHIQGVVASCSECHIRFGFYFCAECRLYDDTEKGQFHCDQCGICRVGGRENFYHCTRCDICIPIRLKSTHTCLESASRSNCVICLEDLHSSREPCQVLRCGHYLHRTCYRECLRCRYSCCPLCAKSMT